MLPEPKRLIDSNMLEQCGIDTEMTIEYDDILRAVKELAKHCSLVHSKAAGFESIEYDYDVVAFLLWAGIMLEDCESAMANLSNGYLRRAKVCIQKELSRVVGKGGRPVTESRRIGRGTRRRIYKTDNYQCVYCGVRVIPDYEVGKDDPSDYGDIATVDHVIPGITDYNNLVTACQSCNATKSNRTPEEAGMELKHGRYSVSNGRHEST